MPCPVSIALPTALRSFAGGASSVSVDADTAGAAIDALLDQHPGLKKHLRAEDGKLRTFINIYLGEDDIRHLQREQTPLKAGDQLLIVPSIAGGRA